MSEYKKVIVRSLPLSTEQSTTPEKRFWTEYKQKKTYKYPTKITNIYFTNKVPYDMAVCTGTNVDVYDSKSQDKKYTLARSISNINAGEFRDDDNVFILGMENGTAQLISTELRTSIRTFKHLQKSLYVAKFFDDGTKIQLGGDDAIVSLIDIQTNTVLNNWKSHNDSIRTCTISPISPNIFFTGSYDHTINMYDTRSSTKEIMKLNHGDLIHDTLIFPSGGLLYSAGGTTIKVWDIVSGGKLLHTIDTHQDIVTNLTLDSSLSRLLSSSLDTFIHIHDTINYENTHSIKYSHPILSCKFSPNSHTLSVGLVNGSLHMRVQDTKNVTTTSKTNTKKHQSRFYHKQKLYNTISNLDDTSTTYIIERERRIHLQEYDKFLKTFQYSAALDAVLQTRNPLAIIVVLEELINRNSLQQALSNRDDVTLEPFLQFLNKYITNSQYSSQLIDIANIVIDIYAPILGQSIVIDELFSRLNKKLTNEIALQTEYTKFQGELETIIASSKHSNDTISNITYTSQNTTT